NPLGAAAPVADALSLLSVVRDVERVDQVANTTHYRFVLDGPRYAEAQRKRYQVMAEAQLPAGVQLQAPSLYQHMTGTGEVWVDAANLPRRVVVTLTLPEINPTSDAQVRMQVDYRDFGAAISPIDAPALGGPDGEWTVPGNDITPVIQSDAAQSAMAAAGTLN